MISDQTIQFQLDDQPIEPGIDNDDPLVRAVLISLFTWRRAHPDDDLPSGDRMGWWGDTYAQLPGDRIGSRLWLLSRAALTQQTILRAREYATEALQWLIDDGVAQRIEVQAERQGLDRLALSCTITRAAGNGFLNLRFDNVWRVIRAV